MVDEADAATLERFRRLRADPSRARRDELVLAHRSIAAACARRFTDRGEPLDDLTQVAMLGLVKAVERFDPEVGVPFAGFAVPTIMGELRRHFRDATWAVHVPRRANDLNVRLPATTEELHAKLGRPPRPAELAEHLGVTVDQVLEGIEAGAAYRTTSSDSPEGAAATQRAVGHVGGLSPEERVLLDQLLLSLAERERRILWLRFFEDLSQSEIAEIVGTSQVHVSRLLRRSLRELRELAGDPG